MSEQKTRKVSMESLKKIAYFGVGDKIPGTRRGPKLRKNCVYHCVDLPDSDWFQEGLQKHISLDKSTKSRVNIEQKNVRDLTWAKESIDEIHICNVMGDPEAKNLNALIEKSIYVLKNEGFIFIEESYTPYPPSQLILEFAARNMDFKLIAPKIDIIMNREELMKFTELTQYINSQKNNNYDKIGEHIRLSKHLDNFQIREDYPAPKKFVEKKYSWGSMSGWFPDIKPHGASSMRLFEFFTGIKYGISDCHGYILRFSKRKNN